MDIFVLGVGQARVDICAVAVVNLSADSWTFSVVVRRVQVLAQPPEIREDGRLRCRSPHGGRRVPRRTWVARSGVGRLRGQSVSDPVYYCV